VDQEESKQFAPNKHVLQSSELKMLLKIVSVRAANKFRKLSTVYKKRTHYCMDNRNRKKIIHVHKFYDFFFNLEDFER